MTITVLYFAKMRSIMGSSREVFETTSTVKELLDKIAAVHPSLASVIPSCAVAVNEKYVDDFSRYELKDNDVVALIPPVSGG